MCLKCFHNLKIAPHPQYGIIFIPEQKCKNYHRKVVLRVFLAHTETGSTGNLARELGSGDFWLGSSSGEQDEPPVHSGTKSLQPHCSSERCFGHVLLLISGWETVSGLSNSYLRGSRLWSCDFLPQWLSLTLGYNGIQKSGSLGLGKQLGCPVLARLVKQSLVYGKILTNVAIGD